MKTHVSQSQYCVNMGVICLRSANLLMLMVVMMVKLNSKTSSTLMFLYDFIRFSHVFICFWYGFYMVFVWFLCDFYKILRICWKILLVILGCFLTMSDTFDLGISKFALKTSISFNEKSGSPFFASKLYFSFSCIFHNFLYVSPRIFKFQKVMAFRKVR